MAGPGSLLKLFASGLVAAAAAMAAGCSSDSDDAGLPAGDFRRVPFGFNDNSVLQGLVGPERAAELAAGAGSRVVRLTLEWRGVERFPGEYDFRVYDAIYAALVRRGIRPLWIVAFAPTWALDRGLRCPAGCRAPPSPAAEPAWERMVAEVARRYPRSFGIEVWNEPNFANFFAPRVDPPRYTRLLKRAYRAVKRVRPRMPVVNGGLANFPLAEPGKMRLPDFLDQVYANGGRRYMDAISIHPYPGDPRRSFMESTVLEALRVRNSHGDRRRPLWVTELGATTTGPDPELRWTEDEQAEVLASAYRRLASVPAIRLVLVHTLIEPRGSRLDMEVGYGLLRGDLSPKPAYCRVARAAGTACPR
jgi:hypothetical protein